MYKSFIRPLLEYRNIIWDKCSQERKNPVRNIQLDEARIATGATKVCSVQKLFNQTGYETLQNRRKKGKLCMMYKMTHNLTRDYLRQLLLPRVQERSRYLLRNPNNCIVPAKRTTGYFKLTLFRQLESAKYFIHALDLNVVLLINFAQEKPNK